MTPASRFKESSIVEVAWRIASSHSHGISQVRLLKLFWLAELRHFEAAGERLTPAEWWRWDYGPYSKDVINLIRKDVRHFRVRREEAATTVGRLAIQGRPTGVPNTLSEQALRSLSDTLDMYASYNTMEILKEVYADPFFENTAYGEDFDFGNLATFRRAVPEAKARALLELETAPVESIEALFG
jgi:hypothetical protein